MTLRAALQEVLTGPDAGSLWTLRAQLLEAEVPADSRVWQLLREFQSYLDELATGTSSRQYSELASRLDIGAVGGIVLDRMLESESADSLAFSLLSAALTEGLMVAATRQHVKAWEGELNAVYRRSAWYLYGELWYWAAEKKPELPAGERRALLDRLLAPIHSAEVEGFSKAVLVGLLFQVLLLSYLPGELGRLP